MRLARFAVYHPVTTCMALAGLLVLGAISIPRVPLAFLPEVDIPFIWVWIPYPNSNPQQVERMITRPIEEALATMGGVKSIRSSSRADEADVELRFDWGQEIDVIGLEVSEKLDRVRSELPPDVADIMIFKFSTSDIPVLMGRLSAPGKDLSQSYELLETKVKNRLERVPGVANIAIWGERIEMLQVNVVPELMKQHEITLDEVREATADALDVGLFQFSDGHHIGAGGWVDTPNQRMQVRYTLPMAQDYENVTADELANMPLAVRDGQQLFLKDVAEVVVGHHHQKFDGTGYFGGKQGKDIPINARIFAVADVFDALTSKRPYKEPMSFDKAMSILEEGSGSHFDPDVLEAFQEIAQALYESYGRGDDERARQDLEDIIETYFRQDAALLLG